MDLITVTVHAGAPGSWARPRSSRHSVLPKRTFLTLVLTLPRAFDGVVVRPIATTKLLLHIAGRIPTRGAVDGSEWSRVFTVLTTRHRRSAVNCPSIPTLILTLIPTTWR